MRTHALLAGTAIVTAFAAVPGTAKAQATEDRPATGQTQEERTAAAATEGNADGIAEIVVTAERRVTNLQDTAASIAVRLGEDLQKQGRFALREILEDVPGVEVAGGSPAAPGNGIFIRGVRPAQTPVGVSAAASTAIYVDQVYNGVGSSFDIGRVEVLRGPQGTLYGRSATGGVVSFYTRNPDFEELEGEFVLEGGTGELRHATGGAGIPIIKDVLAIRVSGNHYERNGFISPEGGYGKVDEIRGKIGFRPFAGAEIILAAVYQERSDNSGGALLANVGGDPAGFTITTVAATGVTIPRISTVEASQHQYYANANFDLGFAKLTYIPAWRKFKRSGLSAVGNTQLQLNETPRDVLHTQELRLAQQYKNGISWVGGLFYYDADELVRVAPRWVGSGALVFDQTTDRNTRNYGVFGEMTVPITDWVRLTGGARYDKTRIQTNLTRTNNTNTPTNIPNTSPLFGLPENLVTLTLSDAAGRSNFKEFTYKARVDADITEDNMVYGMISTGSLPGDVQGTTGAGGLPIALRFAQQELTAYEIGSKNRFFDILQVNGSAFFYDYSGYQSQLNIGTGPSPIFLITTSPAEMKGFELETLLQPTRNDQFTLNVGYTDAKFTGFDSSLPLTVAQSRFGDYVPGIAPWRITGAYSRRIRFADDNQLNVRAAARYNSSYHSANINNAFGALGAAPYTRAVEAVFVDVNATLSLANDVFSLTAYARNLFDKRVKTGSSISGTPITGTGLTFGGNPTVSDPRTVGVVARLSF